MEILVVDLGFDINELEAEVLEDGGDLWVERRNMTPHETLSEGARWRGSGGLLGSRRGWQSSRSVGAGTFGVVGVGRRLWVGHG